MSSNSPIGVLIVCALALEQQAVERFLKDVRAVTAENGDIYHVGSFDISGKRYPIAIAITEAGNQYASIATQRAIDFFAPQLAIFVGIAGGIKDLTVGDVIASRRIYYCEATKQEASKTLIRPKQWTATHHLVMRAGEEVGKSAWLTLLRTVLPDANPKAIVGVIGSVESVVNSRQSEDALRVHEHYNDVQAIENEGHGFGVAIEKNNAVWGIVVRGISDVCEQKSDALQLNAAIHAAAFALNLLGHFQDRLGRAFAEGASVETIVDAKGRLQAAAAAGVADQLLERAKAAIDEGQLGIAEGQLLAYKANHWTLLDAARQYQWSRSMSLVLRRSGRLDEGALLLLDGSMKLPNDLAARSDHAYAMYLLGRCAEGLELARKLIADSPESDKAWFPYVLNASMTGSRAETQFDAMPQAVRSLPKIQLALASFFFAKEDWAHAEASAILASDDPTLLKASQLAGLAILHQLEITKDDSGAVVVSSPERLEEALTHFSREIERCERAGAEKDAVYSYLGRSRAQLLLGRKVESDRDFTIAEKLAPRDPGVQFERARRLSISGDVEASIKAFADLAKEENKDATIQTAISLAIQQTRSGDPSTIERGKTLLKQLLQERAGELDRSEYHAVLEALVRTLAESNQVAEAMALVDAADRVHVEPWFSTTIRAQLLKLQGKTDEAARALEEASNLVAAVGSTFDKRFVGRCAFDLKLWNECFRLMSQSVPINKLTSDVRKVMRAAFESSEHRWYLDAAKQLRERGEVDFNILETELSLLGRTSPMKAYEISAEAYRSGLRNGALYVLMLRWATQAGKISEVQVAYDSLPKRDLVEQMPALAQVTVNVLLAAHYDEFAIRFGYSMYRRFPDLESANVAFVSSVIAQRERHLPFLEDPTAISGDCAVAFTVGGEPSIVWKVIESDLPVRPSLNEVAPGDPLAKSLSQKRVDASFNHPGFSGKPVTAKVISIRNKYTWRFTEVLNGLPDRFPNQKFLQRFKVIEGGGSKARLDLTALESVLKNQQDSVGPLWESFVAGRVPVHALARRLGRTVYEVWPRLMERIGESLPVWSGTQHALSSDSFSRHTPAKLALDQTAIAAISHLDLWPSLDSIELWVTPQLMFELEQFITAPVGEGMLGIANGQPVILDTKEAATARRVKLAKGYEYLKGRASKAEPDLTERIGRREASEVDLFYGEVMASVVALCEQRGIALWSDDLFTGEYLQSVLGISRVFTQQVSEHLRDTAVLTQAQHDRNVAALLISGYWTLAVGTNHFEMVLESTTPENARIVFAAALANPRLLPHYATSIAAKMLAAIMIERRQSELDPDVSHVVSALQTRSDFPAVAKGALTVLEEAVRNMKPEAFLLVKTRITEVLPKQNPLSDWSWNQSSD